MCKKYKGAIVTALTMVFCINAALLMVVHYN